MKREDLLSLRKIEQITSGGVTVDVRRWNGKQRLAFDDAVSKHRRPDKTVNITAMSAIVFMLSVVGEDGLQMFTENDIAIIEDSIPAELLQAVSDWALSANGLMKSGADEAVKN